jgi:hypothetical protein
MRTRLALLLALGASFTVAVPFACGGDVSSPGGGAGSDWASCASPPECAIAWRSCCGACREPTLADVDAVNRERLDEHFREVCPEPVPCPECVTPTSPDLLATCRAGSCVAIDVRADAVSACTADVDCRLRVTGCCACGGSTAPEDLIAIRVDGELDYLALVCAPDVACPACEPVYPDDVEAYCAPDGHCAIRDSGACVEDCAGMGLTCCDGECVGTYNDVRHCGECGNACPGPHPFCDGSQCAAPPCDDPSCGDESFCCGTQCCGDAELCCAVPGPGPSGGPACVSPDERGTCPVGCPLCQ